MTNRDRAYALAKLGLKVFPCDPASKAPLIEGGFKSRTNYRNSVKRWWTNWPRALIGYVPADLHCIGFDIDAGGVDGARQLVALIGQPAAKMRSAQSGRFHLLYPYTRDAGLGGNLQWRYREAGGDTRHENGYLIAWQPARLHSAMLNRNTWPDPLGDAWVRFLTCKTPTVEEYAMTQLLKCAQGERNNTLNRETYGAIRRGADPVVLRKVMEIAADELGLPKTETTKTLESALAAASIPPDAGSQAPAQTQVKPVAKPAGESDLARIMVEENGGLLLHVPEWGWLRWVASGEGGRWRRDPYGAIREAGEVCVRFGRKSRSTIQNVATLARPMMHADVDDFDTQPELLNTPAGPIDLRTGETLPADPVARMTRITGCAPSAKTPKAFFSFLERVQPSSPVRDYLRRFAGYALTGYAREHVLAFFYGTGRNGKGTFIKAVTRSMGEYAQNAKSKIFGLQYGNQHAEIFARMSGARLVVAEEMSQGATWDEALIKELTGGSEIVANFMHQNSFQFEPQFTLCITGNHKPRFRTVDPALRARVHLIPFTEFIPPEERDRTLDDTLAREYPQILGWAIDGAIEYLDGGLRPPVEVLDASTAYLDEQDVVGQFIREICLYDRTGKTPRKEVLERFARWHETEGYGRDPTKGAKSEILSRLQADARFRYERGGQGMTFLGLVFRLDAEIQNFGAEDDVM